MSLLFQLLPLLIYLALYAASFKVAARILRASRVGWAQAFQIAALVGLITIGTRAAAMYVGQLPVVLSALLGLAMHLTLGAWFFRERALASDGQPLGWAGGAKLSAVAVGLIMLVAVVLAIGIPALVSMGKT